MVVFLPRRDGGCGGRGRGLATREILGNYGFIPDLKISTHLNARHVLGDTLMEVYLSHFTKTNSTT